MLWNIATNSMTARFALAEVPHAVCLSSEGGRGLAMCGNYTRSAHIVDIESGRTIQVLQRPENFTALTLSPGGQIAATVDAGSLCLWCVRSGHLLEQRWIPSGIFHLVFNQHARLCLLTDIGYQHISADSAAGAILLSEGGSKSSANLDLHTAWYTRDGWIWRGDRKLMVLPLDHRVFVQVRASWGDSHFMSTRQGRTLRISSETEYSTKLRDSLF